MSLRDRLATANAAACQVADEGRAEQQRRVELLERPTLTFPTAPLPPSHPLASPPATVTEVQLQSSVGNWVTGPSWTATETALPATSSDSQMTCSPTPRSCGC